MDQRGSLKGNLKKERKNQSLWDVAEAVAEMQFYSTNTYTREGRSQINYLSFYLKKPEKEEQNKPTASRKSIKKHKLMKQKTVKTQH